MNTYSLIPFKTSTYQILPFSITKPFLQETMTPLKNNEAPKE